MAIKSLTSNRGLDIPVSDSRGSNKWNQYRRLEFIDFRLCSEGRINRRDLVRFFGISVPQASLDIARYQAMAGDMVPPRRNLEYDRHQKFYVRTADYEPMFPSVCHPASYFNDLLAMCRGLLPPSRNFFGFIPNVGVATFVPSRNNIDQGILFSLLEAIRGHMVVRISYLSVSQQKEIEQLIAPHGLAYDGLRWHIRAYCYEIHGFRDYVLSRIIRCSKPELSAPDDRCPNPAGAGFIEVGTAGRDDADWNELVDMVLIANPELPEAARHAVEMDYGMEHKGSMVYTCRKSLVFYTLKWLRLDEDSRGLSPEQQPLVLLNDAEVRSRMGRGEGSV